VLGPLRQADGQGLNARYEDLIRRSFAPRYWSGQGDFGKPDDGPPFSQMEANFAFFLGLSLQLYEATLISDETPFDTPRGPDGFPAVYNESQKRGHVLFNKAECDFCHRGPGFSAAEHPAVYSELRPDQPPKLVDRRVMNIDRATKTAFMALSDAGYANTGVTPNEFDHGLGSKDPMGHPLSFTEQYVTQLADPARLPLDPVALPAFNFSLRYRIGFEPEELIAPPPAHGYALGNPEQAQIPSPTVAKSELGQPGQGRLAMAVDGAFKVPSLRNVELTGPYMHNGGMKSLHEVIEFYDRGGNVNNREHFGTFVFAQHFTPQEKGRPAGVSADPDRRKGALGAGAVRSSLSGGCTWLRGPAGPARRSPMTETLLRIPAWAARAGAPNKARCGPSSITSPNDSRQSRAGMPVIMRSRHRVRHFTQFNRANPTLDDAESGNPRQRRQLQVTGARRQPGTRPFDTLPSWLTAVLQSPSSKRQILTNTLGFRWLAYPGLAGGLAFESACFSRLTGGISIC
jgi:hypothetical protein